MTENTLQIERVPGAVNLTASLVYEMRDESFILRPSTPSAVDPLQVWKVWERGKEMNLEH